MDTTKTTTHLGLCAGYGGIELGLHRVIRNLRTVALCEIEAFACANLVAKMEAGLLDCAPIWTDLKTFPWAEFRDRVDILTGGYPCQPFSAAGKRLGTEDPRHLWPFIADGIRILRPRLCFFENVEGHISLGLREVIGELGAIGYTAAWGIFSASECGAPHQRKRVFILAHRHGERGQLPDWWREPAEQVPVGYGEARGDGRELVNAQLHGRQDRQHDNSGPQLGGGHSVAWPSRPGEQQFAWEPPRVVGGKLDHPTVGRCDGIDASGGRYVGGGPEAQNFGSAATHSSCCDGKAAGTLANNHRPHAGHGEQRPERTLGDLSGGCGEGGGAEGVAHAGSLGRRGRSDGDEGGMCGEIQTSGSCGGGAEAGMAHAHGGRGEEPEHQQANLPSEPSGGNAEAVGNASSERSRTLRPEPAGQQRQASPASAGFAMGNADSRRLASGLNAGSGSEADRGGQGDIEQADGGMGITEQQHDGRQIRANELPSGQGRLRTLRQPAFETDGECRQTESEVGRDADGTACGLGYAELCVSCDNRTDELRLLGNGVVPATAERAFRTLWEELIK